MLPRRLLQLPTRVAFLYSPVFIAVRMPRHRWQPEAPAQSQRKLDPADDGSSLHAGICPLVDRFPLSRAEDSGPACMSQTSVWQSRIDSYIGAPPDTKGG